MNKHLFKLSLYNFIIIIACFSDSIYSQRYLGIVHPVKRSDFVLKMTDKVLIDCTSFIPIGNKPVNGWPVFIICHGFGESKEAVIPEASDQGQFGYYTFTYSMRGQGHSGGLSNLISTVEMNDLLHIINYIKHDTLADSSRIAIFGASQGGIIPFMAVCYGAKVSTVMSDLASPEFASSWIENGSIKTTFFFSIDYDSSIVRYTNEVKNLRKWALSKELDKWDSLEYHLPKGRDYLVKVPFCKVPVLITNAWQDKFFNTAGMIKAVHLLNVPFMAYFGAVDGHGADSSFSENNFLSSFDNNWEDYWLNHLPAVRLDSEKYQYASSCFPKINNKWSFSHFSSNIWPPDNIVPVSLYLQPNGMLHENPNKSKIDTIGFWNDIKDSSFTMQQAINTSFKGEFFDKRFSKNTIAFETAALPNDYKMVGSPSIDLFYSSTTNVCQFNAQIWEINPALGTDFVTRINYTDRHYNPGDIKEKVIYGPADSHIFKQGSKIRILFTNLDSQPADSFLTTNPYVLPVLKKSYNTIYMGKSYPTNIILPVIGHSLVKQNSQVESIIVK
jgi:predicted acyl esterase